MSLLAVTIARARARRPQPDQTRAAEKPAGVLDGYAAVWGSVADLGPYTEEIARGALQWSDQTTARREHDAGRLLGRWPDTLRLAEDDVGLRYEVELPDTTDGREVAHLVGRGDLAGSSIRMRVSGQSWDTSRGKPHRTVQRAELRDVSPVTDPAYLETARYGLAIRSSDDSGLLEVRLVPLSIVEQ